MENKVLVLKWHDGYDDRVELFSDMETVDEYIYRQWTDSYNIEDLDIIDTKSWNDISKKLVHTRFSNVYHYYMVMEKEVR